jgi:hypothetical protein
MRYALFCGNTDCATWLEHYNAFTQPQTFYCEPLKHCTVDYGQLLRRPNTCTHYIKSRTWHFHDRLRDLLEYTHKHSGNICSGCNNFGVCCYSFHIFGGCKISCKCVLFYRLRQENETIFRSLFRRIALSIRNKQIRIISSKIPVNEYFLFKKNYTSQTAYSGARAQLYGTAQTTYFSLSTWYRPQAILEGCRVSWSEEVAEWRSSVSPAISWSKTLSFSEYWH